MVTKWTTKDPRKGRGATGYVIRHVFVGLPMLFVIKIFDRCGSIGDDYFASNCFFIAI
jgi:hypothetical protein